MASRMMHLAAAKKILETKPIQNPDRFLLGIILPDAPKSGKSSAVSHLKIKVYNGTKKTYDLTEFRNRYWKELSSDSLYLGYYLHLIQDLVYRHFIYEKYHWNPMIPGNVEKLHNDYSLLNDCIIQRYGLENNLIFPRDFTNEKIYELVPTDAEQFQEEIKSDFIPHLKGSIYFFTENMAIEYIEMAAEISIREVSALENGTFLTDEKQSAWK